jgi:uncharacterized damage-inducible protein DinB
MSTKQALLAELASESASTRKLLERVPAEHFGWKPHERSMTLQRLATHIAEIPGWTTRAVELDEFDVMNNKPGLAGSVEELLSIHDASVRRATELLTNTEETAFVKPFALKRGGNVIFELPKAAVIRSLASNHLYHHRGQLTVYLRLLDVPLPGIYGPSADEMIAIKESVAS